MFVRSPKHFLSLFPPHLTLDRIWWNRPMPADFFSHLIMHTSLFLPPSFYFLDTVLFRVLCCVQYQTRLIVHSYFRSAFYSYPNRLLIISFFIHTLVTCFLMILFTCPWDFCFGPTWTIIWPLYFIVNKPSLFSRQTITRSPSHHIFYIRM